MIAVQQVQQVAGQKTSHASQPSPVADEEGIRRHAVAMNAGSSVPLFAGMLTNRPWEEVTRKGAPVERLQLKYTEEEAAMIQVGGWGEWV